MTLQGYLKGIFYWMKLALSWMCIRLYRRLKENRLDFYDLYAVAEPEKVGILSHPNEIAMEMPQPDSHLIKADDKVFYYGVNSQSECLVVSISRLCNQKAEANIYMKLSNGKSYRLIETEDFQQSLGDKNVFSCGGLQMYIMDPLRQWRIFFSGYLREYSEGNSDDRKMVYVKFSMLWKAASDVYDATADLNDEHMVRSMAKAEWNAFLPPLFKLQDSMNFYGQAGVLTGTVFVQDVFEDYELYLFGEKIRSLNDASRIKEREFCHVLGYVHEDGTYIHIGSTTVEEVAQNLNFGFVVQPDGILRNVDITGVTLQESLGKQEVKGTFDADDSYAISGRVTELLCHVNSRDRTVTVNKMKFHLNGKKGSGVRIKGKIISTSPKNALHVLEESESMPLPDALFPMVVTFSESMCYLSEVTGGKGSSLGKLTQLSEDLQNFNVPRGVVVTTASYKTFITSDLLKEIANLESVLYGNSEGDVKETCERVKQKIIAASLPSNILDNIVKNLKKTFGDRYLLNKYAIRSSATGEDTEQMSAAGQMDTFLGVSGLNNILLAVKKCWASQFGPIAVQYKRRYGQVLNSPMAVVIQEMVSCQVAGVIFTCDPLTGNPSTVTITANFGLGESVVSGSEEPDTIELARDPHDNISICKVSVGAKSRKIVLKGEGTDTEEVAEEDKHQCCLSNEDALKLGRLAVEIEKYYRSRRDIEWGIKDGKIYMFQSRPVTSGSQETDYEIEHELDSPLRIENDYYSVSHAGEVLPGAMSTLGSEVMFTIFLHCHQKAKMAEWQSSSSNRFFRMGWMQMCSNSMFNIADLLRPQSGKKAVQAIMVAFFGRVVELDEALDISSKRYKIKKQGWNWLQMYHMYKNLLFSHRRLNECLKKIGNNRIPIEKYKTSKELFYAICQHYSAVEEAMISHMVCSGGSSLMTMHIFSLLSEAKKNIDADVYSDFAALVKTTSDVESADVPSAIQNLGQSISKSIQPSKFKAMKPEEALNFLQTSPTLAAKKFKEFLERHGHRCYKEFDVYSTPWAADPIPLVKLLQNASGNVKTEDGKKDNNILQLWKKINTLKVPLGLLDKLKLLIMVPLSRKAVGEREMTKSMTIKDIDAYRQAYYALAKRMVSEGRLPNEKIIFFMRHNEIKELLETRSPKILSRAYHRQRLYPKMAKYKFPEIMRGLPKPIKDEDFDVPNSEDCFSMKGIPVSQGVAKGYVRVAVTVEEAAKLKPGEILIAYGTDIAWSPFFPILAGVATELGGLISHGAVVSREYGLPCVAALNGVTRRFKTGDYVILDGNKGILQKIPPPTN